MRVRLVGERRDAELGDSIMAQFIDVIQEPGEGKEPPGVGTEQLPGGRCGLRVVEATVGIGSNSEQMLHPPRFSLLLSDFHRLATIAFDNQLDGYLYVYDDPQAPPRITVGVDRVVASGAFGRLEQECSDPRFSLFGNEGLFFRYVLALLEEKHDIFSLHACALYQPDEDRLLVIAGGAGSGKSCFLMSGIEKGLQVLATEMVHFRIDRELSFFKGSLLDNVRLANLRYDYPQAVEMLGLELPQVEAEWETKLCVDLSDCQVDPDRLVNPKVVVVFPHIEQRAPAHILRIIEDRRQVIKGLYDKATEKVAEPTLLYESVPMPPLQGPQAAQCCLEAVTRLVNSPHLIRTVSVYGAPQTCLEGLL